MRTRTLAAAATLLLAACTPPPPSLPLSELRLRVEEWLLRLGRDNAHALYERGLEQYESGNYVEAAYDLDLALTRGLSGLDRALAHKHLAFIYCAAELEPACRGEFRKALIADPAMDLDAAEAGHPAWGPVFRLVKAQR